MGQWQFGAIRDEAADHSQGRCPGGQWPGRVAMAMRLAERRPTLWPAFGARGSPGHCDTGAVGPRVARTRVVALKDSSPSSCRPSARGLW